MPNYKICSINEEKELISAGSSHLAAVQGLFPRQVVSEVHRSVADLKVIGPRTTKYFKVGEVDRLIPINMDCNIEQGVVICDMGLQAIPIKYGKALSRLSGNLNDLRLVLKGTWAQNRVNVLNEIEGRFYLKANPIKSVVIPIILQSQDKQLIESYATTIILQKQEPVRKGTISKGVQLQNSGRAYGVRIGLDKN